MLLGQAIVSYEVFTGKTLPRRGLARYWRNALILAAGFGGLLAVSLGLPLDQSYRLQLALVIVAVFYALLELALVRGARAQPRAAPAVRGQRAPGRPPDVAAPGGPHPPARSPYRAEGASLASASPFSGAPTVQATILLRARGVRVYLCPVGPLASLVGAPLAVAGRRRAAVAGGAGRPGRRGSARRGSSACRSIRPTHGGAAWAVPLWGERSLIGLLLLGERRDGSLYTQEEIEIARAAGERLIDARAAGELARRLLLLQRRRLSEDQMLDSRVRRALHDDVLPLLHTALLGAGPRQRAAGVERARRRTDGRARSPMPTARSRPCWPRCRRRWRRTWRGSGWSGRSGGWWTTWAVSSTAWPGRSTRPASARRPTLSPLAAEVLFGAAREAIRNAARHARPDDRSRPLHLGIAVALDEATS